LNNQYSRRIEIINLFTLDEEHDVLLASDRYSTSSDVWCQCYLSNTI